MQKNMSRPAKRMSWLSMALSFVMMFSLLVSVAAETAEAKSSRLAVITDVGGDATVQAAGASQAYDAYTNMGLNQGDLIVTGANSYVVLKIKDTDDELTIGADSEVYISELAKKGSGKSSKLKMWAGSVWSSVKKLVSDDDELQVETPTAVMAVQGTNYLVTVNPKTKETSVIVASGVVRVDSSSVLADPESQQTMNTQENRYVLVYPAQQINLDKRDEVKDLRTKVEFIDMGSLVNQAPPKVLESIIKNKAEIDKENAEFLEKQKQQLEQNVHRPAGSTLLIKDQSDLDKIGKNLDNLVGNLAKAAIDEKKIQQKTIDEANKKIDDPLKKLDLSKVEQLDKTAGSDPELEKLKASQKAAADAEKLRQQAEEQRRLLDMQARLEAVLKQIENEKKALDEANKKAQEELQRQAEAAYLQSLTEAEKAKFEESKKNLGNQTANPAPVTQTPTGTSNETPSNSTTSVTWSSPVSATQGLPATVTARAVDADGVAQVQFFVSWNGSTTPISGSVSKSGDDYSIAWTPYQSGTATLIARVTDSAGQVYESTKQVSVSPQTGVQLQFTSPPASNTGTLSVSLQGYDYKAIQIHFLTAGQRIVTTTEPVSDVFDPTSNTASYVSGLNEYSDGNGNYEYVFAAMNTNGTANMSGAQVLRAVIQKQVSPFTITLAFIKIVKSDGTVVELTPTNLSAVVTGASS
ncbi:FecR domain-containing protein [Gorillibacterium sp. sgz5001074]|uniref:FecR domain-containing protein n=1 Tax=Gorillibacterium sp. sgz5001074 TaxID=3446695 RepID=UPI003F6626A2